MNGRLKPKVIIKIKIILKTYNNIFKPNFVTFFLALHLINQLIRATEFFVEIS
jgi:hypothetical protein